MAMLPASRLAAQTERGIFSQLGIIGLGFNIQFDRGGSREMLAITSNSRAALSTRTFRLPKIKGIAWFIGILADCKVLWASLFSLGFFIFLGPLPSSVNLCFDMTVS
ncbi:hypothetical protein N7453_011989 [Penicillium expansum]|nr:hypothetical protein N7453_011989 [Penicillium expansum]